VHYRHCEPSYYFGLYYNWGPYRSYSWCYPYYHRKYVFVSLGGYWPSYYRYSRYYWYGYHPYYWYGYYPIAYEVPGNTYYTYNYYGDDSITYYDSEYPIVDHTTFADVRAQLAEGPEEPSPADEFFEQGVTTFEQGDYIAAAEAFAQAMALEPDDMILPFAYCQALFASGDYAAAAAVLREAMAKVSPDEEGVFYPRGLYPDEETLFDQIAELADKAEIYNFDANLQLLLGYNLLGIGQFDEAVDPLRLASMDMENAQAATVLLNLLEKARAAEAEAQVQAEAETIN
jgi:uncharacterized protein HemY